MQSATIHESSFIETSPTRTASVQPGVGFTLHHFLVVLRGDPRVLFFFFAQIEQSYNDMTLFSDASLLTRYVPSSSPPRINHLLKLTNFKCQDSLFPTELNKLFLFITYISRGEGEESPFNLITLFWNFPEPSHIHLSAGSSSIC